MSEPAELVTYEAAGLARIYDTNTPAEVVRRATEQAATLADVIEKNHMYTIMGTREVEIDLGNGRTAKQREVQKHIHVDAWQFIGVMTGVTAKVEWTRKLRDDYTDEWRPPKLEWRQVERPAKGGGTYTKNVQLPKPGEEGLGGWEARVVLVTSDGHEIAGAEAECSWEEERWQAASSSAVRSMAQTRAESKAFRSVFGWIPKMAGYNPTPEEEMEQGGRRIEQFDVVPGDITDNQRLVWSQKASVFHAPNNDLDTAKTWWEAAMVAAGFERPSSVKNLPVDKAQLVLDHLQSLAEEMEAPFESPEPSREEADDVTDAEVVDEEEGDDAE